MNCSIKTMPPGGYRLQQGAALITVLVIMIIITLLGLTGMRMGISSLALASNSQASNILFQAADVGMMEFTNQVNLTPGYADRKMTIAGNQVTGFLVDAVAVAVDGDPAGIPEFNFCFTPKLAVRLTPGICDVTNSNNFISGRDTVAVQLTVKQVRNNEIILGSDINAISSVRGYKFLVYATAVLPSFGSASKSEINTCLARTNDDGDSFSLEPQSPDSVAELAARQAAITTVTDCLTNRGAVFSTSVNQVIYGVPGL